jgi:glutamate synthase domain-containing protein 1
MCGIVGLLLKDRSLRPRLGELMVPMLIGMTERGPDSAGLAVFGKPVDASQRKLSLYAGFTKEGSDFAWQPLVEALDAAMDVTARVDVKGNHAVLTVQGDIEGVKTWLREHHPKLYLLSSGRSIDLYKDIGSPSQVAERYDFAKLKGKHLVGHTRMATESAVTTDGAHPFSTGSDQCLVHNGSLSNHNSLRRSLMHDGLQFRTENDSEVAAAYLTWRMRQGLNLEEALGVALDDLDGFYTFVVGTETGFAVLRDPVACKPAVMAETPAYVAFGSEYRALVDLPGINHARVWEPEPATVYFWERAA